MLLRVSWTNVTVPLTRMSVVRITKYIMSGSRTIHRMSITAREIMKILTKEWYNLFRTTCLL